MDDKPEKLYMKCSRELLLIAGYQVDGQRRFQDLASQKLMLYSMHEWMSLKFCFIFMIGFVSSTFQLESIT